MSATRNVIIGATGLLGSHGASTTRSRRLARDYERTAAVLAGWHWVAFTDLMLNRVFELAQEPIDSGS